MTSDNIWRSSNWIVEDFATFPTVCPVCYIYVMLQLDKLFGKEIFVIYSVCIHHVIIIIISSSRSSIIMKFECRVYRH